MNKFTGYKKSILFSIGFLFFILMLKAQEPTRARLLFMQNNLETAKESIDSFVQLNSASAPGWLLKAQVYNAIAKDLYLKDLVADGRMEAFLALQKAVQLDKPYTEQELNPDKYKLAFDLYIGYTDEGVAYFNAGAERNDKSSYATALSIFKKAALLSRFIHNNGWGLAATDTNNLYYSAKAAINAGKEEDAFLFTRQIADKEILGTPINRDFEGIYQWLAYYYKTKSDEPGFIKLTGFGREKYPGSDFFPLLLLDWYRSKNDYTSLLDIYASKKPVIKETNRVKYELTYCNDIFNYLYTSGIAITGRQVYYDILTRRLEAFTKANPGNTSGLLLAGKFFINRAADVQKEMAASAPTDPAIKTDFKMRINNRYKKSNTYLLSIVNEYPKADKGNYKEALRLLISNYRRLGMVKEVKNCTALQKSAGR